MEEMLRARLLAQVAGVAVDWGMNAQMTIGRRIVLTVVSGMQDMTQGGPDGLRSRRVQIDCYGPDYRAAKEIARDVITTLGGWRDAAVAGCFLDAERDLSPDTGSGEILHRVSLDFMIHHKET